MLMPGSPQVLKSIGMNWRRLMTVVVFNVMILFLYGICGLLFFESQDPIFETHRAKTDCSTLLQCFLSYTCDRLTCPLISFRVHQATNLVATESLCENPNCHSGAFQRCNY
jgi:hypothetical protein